MFFKPDMSDFSEEKLRDLGLEKTKKGNWYYKVPDSERIAPGLAPSPEILKIQQILGQAGVFWREGQNFSDEQWQEKINPTYYRLDRGEATNKSSWIHIAKEINPFETMNGELVLVDEMAAHRAKNGFGLTVEPYKSDVFGGEPVKPYSPTFRWEK